MRDWSWRVEGGWVVEVILKAVAAGFNAKQDFREGLGLGR
jgi:hypothetical protein